MKFSGLLTSVVIGILFFLGEQATVVGAPTAVAEPVYKRGCTGSQNCADWKRQDGGLGQETVPVSEPGQKRGCTGSQNCADWRRQDGGLGQESVPRAVSEAGKKRGCTGSQNCADWKRQDGGLGQERGH